MATLLRVSYLSHNIYVWDVFIVYRYISTYIYHKDQPNVSKYTIHMDPVGIKAWHVLHASKSSGPQKNFVAADYCRAIFQVPKNPNWLLPATEGEVFCQRPKWWGHPRKCSL